MAAAAQRPRRMPPLEIVREILPRLPPREPACLLRASLVCKAWADAISEPAFRRRLHDLHGTPPVLGFLHNWDDEAVPRFIPTTDSPFSLAAPDCRSWRALDFRHGRALFLSKGRATWELLMWEPITGSSHLLRVPEAFETDHGTDKMPPTAAVLCAVDGCEHRDCCGGPFRLVFLFSVEVDTADDEAHVTAACVYSSDTSTWGEPTSVHGVVSMSFTLYSSVLAAKDSLLYFMSDNVLILEYDLAKHNLTVIHPPDYMPGNLGRFNIILAQDDPQGLGVCQYLDPNLRLWTREASEGTDARWVRSQVISLRNMVPLGSLLDRDTRVQVLGFAEVANVMFFNTVTGIFTVELQSRKARKVYDKRGFCNLIPVVSFYTPVPRGEHQDPPSLGLSEEAGSDEKTVDQAQQLLDKGSSAIKEGVLVNAFKRVSHDTEIRVPGNGEVALECANMEYKHGDALPSEAQEVTDPFGDVPNSALNEELVKSTSTTSTSSSNIEDDAPPSEKGDSEEGDH
ncbi:hypothetical protein ACQ4PT_072166 [Festuca glaucescens]